MKFYSFDFWNTLATPNPTFIEERDKFLARELNLPIDDVRSAYRLTKDRLDGKAATWGAACTPLTAMHQLDGALPSFMNAYKLMRGFQRLARENPPMIIDRAPLEELAKDSRLFVISNTNFIGGETIRSWLEDYPFELLVFSDELGVSKPHRDIFRAVHYHLIRDDPRIRPENITHVGDNDRCDGFGADRAQFKFHKVENPSETLEYLHSLTQKEAYA